MTKNNNKYDFWPGQGYEKERKRKAIDGIDFEFYVGPKFMEIKLVLDIAFVTENSPNPTEYALALMNIVSFILFIDYLRR